MIVAVLGAIYTALKMSEASCKKGQSPSPPSPGGDKVITAREMDWLIDENVYSEGTLLVSIDTGTIVVADGAHKYVELSTKHDTDESVIGGSNAYGD